MKLPLKGLVSGVAGGSRIKLILVILAVLVALIAAGALGWVLYDFGGLRLAKHGLVTQGKQNQALQKSLIEDRKAEVKDHERIDRAGKAAAKAADLDGPGDPWLTVWLNCVHATEDQKLRACAAGAHQAPGSGLPAAPSASDQAPAAGGAQQDRNRPPAGAAPPGDHRRAAKGVPGVSE